MSDEHSVQDRLIRRVQRELQRQFRIAGKGSVSRVQEQLGLGRRFFLNQRRKSRQRFDLKVLFSALGALRSDAAEFFVAALGPADPVAAFRSAAATLARGRKRPPRILELEAERDPDAAGRPDAVEFSELDALRYDDPKLAKRRAKQLISEVNAAQLPWLLGCYASACRVEGKLEEAQVVLGRALDLAAEDRRSDVLGDLILRSCCIAGDRGEFETALALAERGTLIYARSGDRIGLGKASVEQGNWLFCLGRHRRALTAYRSALNWFGSHDTTEVVRNRVCCLMNCAVIYHKLKDLDRAEAFARKARAAAPEVGRVLLGKILAFQAAIARQRGRYEDSASFLREAIRAHADVAPLDTAFSVVELCRLQLERGQTRQVYATAKILLPLLDKLEKNPLAATYVTELLRCAVAGRGLTLELLNRVASGLKKGHQRSPRR